MEGFSSRNSLIFAPLNCSMTFAMCASLLQVPGVLGTDGWPRPLPQRPQHCGKPGGVWTLQRLPEACHAYVRIDAILAGVVLDVSIWRRVVRRLLPRTLGRRHERGSPHGHYA